MLGLRKGVQQQNVHNRRRDSWDDEEPNPSCDSVPHDEWSGTDDWTQSLHDAVLNLQDEMEENRKELSRVDGVCDRLERLEEEYQGLLENATLVVPITSFSPEPFVVVKTIMAVVQPLDDDFQASFFDANVNAAGCNQQEAIDNLKDLLLSRFQFLADQSPKNLGPSLAKQLAVLSEFIDRRR